MVPEARHAFAGETDRPAPLTVDLMMRAAGRIAAQWCDAWKLAAGDSLFLVADSANDGWIAEQGATASLREHGIRIFSGRDSSQARRVVSLRVTALSVSFSDLSREGLFGDKSVKRTVRAEVAYRDRLGSTGEVLHAGTAASVLADTVHLDDLASLQSAGIPRTAAIAPQETFLDQAVEPFLILGAAGLAVYLLFHIRS